MSPSDVVDGAEPTANAEGASKVNVEENSERIPRGERVPDAEAVSDSERVPGTEHLTGPEHPPDDLAKFDPQASTGELVGQIRRLRGQHDRAGYAGFCCRWATIQRLYVMKVNAKSHEEFVEGCHECGLGYSLAQEIIRWRLPARAMEIWQRAMAEANAARAQEKWYESPSFSKMVGWYAKKPPPTANDTSSASGGDEEEEQEQEAGENRTPKQIRIDNLHLEDENRKLTLRLNKIEQELEETREHDNRHWQLAKERHEQVVTLREELVRVQSEAAALREQVDTLQRGDTVIDPTSPEVPVVPPEEPDPVVVAEEPVETKPVVLADVVLTDDQRGEIDARFGLKPWAGTVGAEDGALMTKRAAILQAGQFNKADAMTLRRASKGFVRECATLDDVIQRLPTERERQATAALTRKNAKAKAIETAGEGQYAETK